MPLNMSPELYWTILTTLLTSLLWMPHIVQRVLELKPYEAFRDPHHDIETRAPWAQRAIRAHTNAVENLVVFGVLALAVHTLGAGTALTASAAAAYFFARLFHYVFYVLGLPWLRTPMFLVGFACQLVMAGTLLGIL
jgi:uncharacterized MAPEG superfamily protein